jgi:hypothetical protein
VYNGNNGGSYKDMWKGEFIKSKLKKQLFKRCPYLFGKREKQEHQQ